MMRCPFFRAIMRRRCPTNAVVSAGCKCKSGSSMRTIPPGRQPAGNACQHEQDLFFSAAQIRAWMLPSPFDLDDQISGALVETIQALASQKSIRLFDNLLKGAFIYYPQIIEIVLQAPFAASLRLVAC